MDPTTTTSQNIFLSLYMPISEKDKNMFVRCHFRPRYTSQVTQDLFIHFIDVLPI